MDLATFETLFIIQSLDRAIGEAMQRIEAENERVKQIQHQIDERQNECVENKTSLTVQRQELSKLEGELAKTEEQLSKSKEHLKASTGQVMADAADKEIHQLTSKMDELEQAALSRMEQIEQLQEKASHAQEFVTGASCSLEEIASEVKNKIEEEKKIIQGLDERITGQLEDLSPSIRDIFQNLNRKYRFKRPLAVVENGRCSECGMGVSEISRSKIASGSTLEFCTACDRILAPHPEQTLKPVS